MDGCGILDWLLKENHEVKIKMHYPYVVLMHIKMAQFCMGQAHIEGGVAVIFKD